jgi:hypothetical protein
MPATSSRVPLSPPGSVDSMGRPHGSLLIELCAIVGAALRVFAMQVEVSDDFLEIREDSPPRSRDPL